MKLTPQGPDQAVLVPALTTSHGPSGSFGAGGIFRSCGCPDSIRVMSGSAPVAVGLKGVWQSWQPEVSTMYLPRAALSTTVPVRFVGSAAWAGKVAIAPTMIDTMIAISRVQAASAAGRAPCFMVMVPFVEQGRG